MKANVESEKMVSRDAKAAGAERSWSARTQAALTPALSQRERETLRPRGRPVTNP